MKRSTKITSIIVIFFLIIAGVIIARTMIGNHFKKKFSKRPPPGIIVKTVEQRKFQNIIETFGTAVPIKTQSYNIEKYEILEEIKYNTKVKSGDVIAKLGASPVSLPGGQIYENLVSGAIDATEWVGAWNDEILKFHEAAKYYYTAGMHEPGSMIAAGFNAKWWSDLSSLDKQIIEAAATAENEMMMSEYNGNSGAAFARLINDHGVQVRAFNDDVPYDQFTMEHIAGDLIESPRIY